MELCIDIFLPIFSFDVNEIADNKLGVTIAPPPANTIINPYTTNSLLKNGKAIKDIPDISNPKAICFFFG